MGEHAARLRAPPPHAPDRPEPDRAAAVQRAESVADLVGRLAFGAEVLPGEVWTAEAPPDALSAAAQVLRDTGRRWSALEPGAAWTLEWGRPARG